MQLFELFGTLDGEFVFQHADELLCVKFNNVGYGNLYRHIVADDEQVAVYRLFAFGIRVKRIDDIGGIHAARKLYFDIDGFRRVIVDRRDAHFIVLCRFFDRIHKRLGRRTERQFGDRNLFFVA